MSITPLMSGTPGTRKSGLVAIATSAVQSKPNADEAQSEARKAELCYFNKKRKNLFLCAIIREKMQKQQKSWVKIEKRLAISGFL